MAAKPYVRMRKLVDAARARQDKATAWVFSFAPDNRTPFWDCYKVASDAAKHEYEEATRALDAAEQAAIDAGTAWRASFGMLTFYK